MSMKVERSSVEQVRQRFEALKKKKEEKTKEYDLTERIQELKEEVYTGLNNNYYIKQKCLL
jgi:U4/U6.U5 tri-snRNP component SNU23